MADIRELWKNSERSDPPELQFRRAIIDAGLEPPSEVILDGKIHRFNSGSKGRHGFGDKSGWYVGYSDGIPAGRFGDWRWGVEHNFVADIGRKLTAREEMEFARHLDEARKVREAAEKKMRENVADIVDKIWSESAEANADHPYLVKKRIDPNALE